jgi:hypothetical protein
LAAFVLGGKISSASWFSRRPRATAKPCRLITEATVDGKRRRATWKSEISTPTLTTHLAGERYFGIKKGRMTMHRNSTGTADRRTEM